MPQDYMIVKAGTPEKLEERVREMAAEGWTAQGGASRTPIGFIQAMVRTIPAP